MKDTLEKIKNEKEWGLPSVGVKGGGEGVTGGLWRSTTTMRWSTLTSRWTMGNKSPSVHWNLPHDNVCLKPFCFLDIFPKFWASLPNGVRFQKWWFDTYRRYSGGVTAPHTFWHAVPRDNGTGTATNCNHCLLYYRRNCGRNGTTKLLYRCRTWVIRSEVVGVDYH